MPRTDGRPKVLHRLGLFATAAAILGLALAWLRLVPALVGFALLALGGLVAIVVALSTGVQAIRGREARLGGLLAVVVAVVWVLLVRWLSLRSPWMGFVIGFTGGGLLGWGLMRLRWAVWRRRHPELSTEEYIEKVIRPQDTP